MKRIIKSVLLVLLVVFTGWISYSIYRKIQIKRTAEKNTATIPPFHFITLNKQEYNSTSVKSGKVIVNFFSPQCEHCQYMTEAYLQHAQQLDSVRILMITAADSNTVARFAAEYKINTMPNITLLLDRELQFPVVFGSASVPSFFVYENNRLVKKISGETRIENLLN